MTARQYRRSERIEHPPARLYQLVRDIDQYSSFLPWCSRSVVHRQGGWAYGNSAPKDQAPESHAPENHAPENHAPENHAPENHAPENHAPENHAPENHAPENHEIVATLEMSMGPITQSFTTRNRLDPESEIEMTLVEGPFRQLHGLWRFTPEKGGCLIQLEVDFEFSNRLLDLAFGPLFRIACESLIGAFRQRADEQFGRKSRLPPSTSPS